MNWFSTWGDIPYKLLRKALPMRLYQALRKTPLGRAKIWERAQTYRDIAQFYQDYLPSSLEGKVVLELGCGVQPFTALHLLGQGAQHVICLEPKFAQIPSFEFADVVQLELQAQPELKLTANSFAERSTFCANLDGLPSQWLGRIDVVLSHLVLEHVSDMNGLWNQMRPYLSSNVQLLHRVDPSDHTYHAIVRLPVLKNIWKGRELCHLQYSQTLYNWLDDPKCNMNRLLLPHYRSLARSHGYTTEVLRVFEAKKVDIHADVLSGCESTESEVYLTDFVLLHFK